MTVTITGNTTDREMFDISCADVEDGKGMPILNLMIEGEPPTEGQEPVVIFDGYFDTVEGAEEFEREVTMAVQGFRQQMQKRGMGARQMSESRSADR